MKAPFHIELLKRNGELLNRHTFYSLPITIGRGYDNDLILDDPFIAAHHARIQQFEDGSCRIYDLNTHNGLVYRNTKLTHVDLNPDTIVRLGHTQLRLRSADYKVASEMIDNTRHSWEGKRPAVIGFLLIVLLSVISTWLSNTTPFSAAPYVMSTLILLGIIAVWCGAWSFINRVISGHTRFGRHLFIAASAMALMDIWKLLSFVLAYAYSLGFLTRYAAHSLSIGFSVMLFFHLKTVKPYYRKKLVALCFSLCVIISGIIVMASYQRNGRSSEDLYTGVLLPPVMRQSQNLPIGQFMQQATLLKPQLEEGRLKPVNANSVVLDWDED